MKTKKLKKKASVEKGRRNGKRFSMNQDPFFTNESKRRRKVEDDDVGGVIESDESEDDFEPEPTGRDEEDVEETTEEKRKRVAEAYLEKIRALAKREGEDHDDEEDRERVSERSGERDSLVAQILQQEQLEESGRLARVIASRYLNTGASNDSIFLWYESVAVDSLDKSSNSVAQLWLLCKRLSCYANFLD